MHLQRTLRNQARYASYRLALHRSRAAARTELAMFERSEGRLLPHADRRAARQYAGDTLGHPDYAAWLDVYAMVRGRFIEGWIPMDFFDLVVMPHVNGSYRSLSIAKSFTYRVFRSDRFPDVAQIVRGRYYDLHGDPIPASGVRRALYDRGGTIVVKDDGGSQSRLVTHYDEATFQADHVARDHPNATIQFAVADHPTFVALSGGTGAKLRIVTVRAPGERAVTRGAYLGLARRGDAVTRCGRSVFVSIDVASGKTRYAYRDGNAPGGRHADTRAPREHRRSRVPCCHRDV